MELVVGLEYMEKTAGQQELLFLATQMEEEMEVRLLELMVME